VKSRQLSTVACLTLSAICFGIAVPSCFANCVTTNEQAIHEALIASPPTIQSLENEIRYKSGNEVEAAIVRRFGPAARDLGSGVSIKQWDVGTGVLTYSGGLASFSIAGGKTPSIWLTQTNNKALRTLIMDGFEMTSLASPKIKYWLGDLDLKTGLAYKFVDSQEWESLHHREKQQNNFFLRHPAGRFAIQFAPGCSPDTVLERLPDTTVLCRLTFIPADGSPEATYDIIVYPNSRRLTFSRKKPPLEFLMGKSW